MNGTSAASTVVVDASVAVWAVLPVPAQTDVLGLFADWCRRRLRVVAPMLCLAESVSAIRGAVSTGAITSEEGRTAVEDLLALEMEVVPMTADHCRGALAWAERLGESRAYDGFYLALAEELGAELWTADRRLANGARQIGVTWVQAV